MFRSIMESLADLFSGKYMDDVAATYVDSRTPKDAAEAEKFRKEFWNKINNRSRYL